jgi:hypothetical protein
VHLSPTFGTASSTFRTSSSTFGTAGSPFGTAKFVTEAFAPVGARLSVELALVGHTGVTSSESTVNVMPKSNLTLSRT